MEELDWTRLRARLPQCVALTGRPPPGLADFPARWRFQYRSEPNRLR